MNERLILMIMIALPALTGCSRKETEPQYVGTSTFPLTTDSRWEYVREYFTIPFNDSALADTDHYRIDRHVIGPDTVIDGNQTIAVDDSIAWLDGDGTPYVKRHLYSICDSKLKEFGYVYIFGGGGETDPTYFDPPHIILDLPITPYKTWTESAEDSVLITNTVLGIQYVTVADSEMKCDVVLSSMIDAYSGDVYYDFHLWYSNSGLIRYEADYGISVVQDTGGVVIDSVRRSDVLELVEMSIESE